MKIIACYEDSNSSREAVRQAVRHAAVWNAQVEVLNAVKRDKPIKHDRLRQQEAELETVIQALLGDLSVGINVSLLTDNIEAGEQVVHFAERKKADLIFLGLKKASRVGKMLFGSNAQFIILNAHCPVVTMKAPN